MVKQMEETRAASAEHCDVLIVGAGISGVGGAYFLRQQCPDINFVILDAEETFGGTWWTHRFPGIRSDSDLYTFGYSFKPWVGPPIATAEEILSYMDEVIGRTIWRDISVTAIKSLRPIGLRKIAFGPSWRCVGIPAKRFALPAVFYGCAKATIAITKAIRPIGRAWMTSRVSSDTQKTGRKI